MHMANVVGREVVDEQSAIHIAGGWCSWVNVTAFLALQQQWAGGMGLQSCTCLALWVGRGGGSINSPYVGTTLPP
jgi:hypothetical protein